MGRGSSPHYNISFILLLFDSNKNLTAANFQRINSCIYIVLDILFSTELFSCVSSCSGGYNPILLNSCDLKENDFINERFS